jgi:ABC-type lipoprotein export system ATPase subunit
MGPSGAGKSTLLNIISKLDEPTGNLHTEHGKQIMELLKTLNSEGITIIQVTHNEQFALYGSRIIRLVDGMISSDRKCEDKASLIVK